MSQDLNSHLDLTKDACCPYFETSSLSDTNVQEVFEFIFQKCLPLSAKQLKQQRDPSVVDLMEASGEGKGGGCKC